MNKKFAPIAGALLLAMAVMVGGCSEKQRTLVTEFPLNQDPPATVAALTGFSFREDWGRWSDADVAPTAKIQFKNPLPRKFLLTLKAQVVNPENESPKLRIGSFEKELFIQKIGESVSVPVELEQDVDTVEIVPAAPVSPKSLGVNDDPRRLGVGLFSVKIEQ